MIANDAPFSSPAAKSVYDKVYAMWSEGNQAEAERILNAAASKFQGDIRLAFFAATLIRSRFQIEEAASIFAFVANRIPKTRQGQAARLMLLIDQNKDAMTRFQELGKLAMTTKPAEPLIIWLYAIAARTLRQNKAGIQAYALLLKQVKVGSSLIHQTFANLLDKEDRYAESLVHRRLAVKLEPAPWSYDGLAMTLYLMNREAESLKIFEQFMPKSPNFALGWHHWGFVLGQMGRNKEALEKMDRALALAPDDPGFQKEREDVRKKLR
jgi:tetratricopeptide (TPR) repeat protein